MVLFLSKIIRVLISFLMLFSQTAPHFFELPIIPSGQEIGLEERFELVWEDEFNGDSLDMTKWNHNWWEVERKGGYWHEDMVDVRDGNLVITTAYFTDPPENYYEDYFAEHPGHEYKEGWYTACITTKGKFEQCYGYFECRAILPASSGMWSAFWMMNTHVEEVDGSGQDGTEVDIFESMYYKDYWWGAGNTVISGIHYDGYGEGQQSASIGKWWVDNNPYTEYNTYGLEWTPEEYIFYINGVETGRLSKGGVSQNPEYLILSCEVAGENGVAWADRHGVGEMSMDTDETAEFIVDYVRVYTHK